MMELIIKMYWFLCCLCVGTDNPSSNTDTYNLLPKIAIEAINNNCYRGTE
jgi:hypothetical protein